MVTIRLRKTGGKSLQQKTGQMQCSISKLLLLYITKKKAELSVSSEKCLDLQFQVGIFVGSG